MDQIIKVTGVSFHYNSFDVLRDISFEVKKGDYIGLVGHNGSGKTTLIKIILGLLKPCAGEITLFDTPLSKFRNWKKIGYMPQSLSLLNPVFPATVGEVVTLGLLAGKNFPKTISQIDHQKVLSMLSELRIEDLKSRLISSLSGGQQQKVFLAKALIAEPELLILDEPGNALDNQTRNNFFKILQDLNQDHQTTIILITHDVGQVGTYTNKLMYLDQKLVYYGSFPDFCKSDNMTKEFGLDTQHIICHQHG
jgi:zinc transport system ATP-binding protein